MDWAVTTSYGIGVLVRLHNKLAKQGGDVKVAAVDLVWSGLKLVIRKELR